MHAKWRLPMVATFRILIDFDVAYHDIGYLLRCYQFENPRGEARFYIALQFEAFGYQFLTTTVKNREGHSSRRLSKSANGWSFLCASPARSTSMYRG